MSHPDSSLPEAWVERIWQAMRATYGATFDRQWECPAGADPVEHVRAMKAFWGRELSRYQQNPQAIRYGLENLPTFPPNLIEFRAICNRRPDAVQPMLPAPPADPERVKALMADVVGKLIERQASPAAECAGRLRKWQADGVKLGSAQKAMLAACEQHIGGGVSEAALMAGFSPVDPKYLPAGMRA